MKKMRPATVLSGYIATRLEMIVATVALKIDIVRGCWRSIIFVVFWLLVLVRRLNFMITNADLN